MEGTIQLVHGDGGLYTHQLIREMFYSYFDNDFLLKGLDSAILPNIERIAFTTDSFVVKPLFFSGGNIGKLSICGTVNDLVVSGARPLYLSVSFVIEEGFSLQRLEEIVCSMAEECKAYGVKIVTGDTKVVERGGVDGLFINTAGIGSLLEGYQVKPIKPGDHIIVTGSIAEHGTAIAVERYGLKVKGDVRSDCSVLLPFLEAVEDNLDAIRIMRDPTRGGLASVLHEFCELCGYGVHLLEDKLPIRNEVRAVNQMLGLDPLYLACEGRMILVVEESETQRMIERIRRVEQGRSASVIGCFVEETEARVLVENYFGGIRRLPQLEVGLLPRIC